MNDIKKAVELLNKGEVVAIPTETVYGLAGSVLSEAGLRKIFEVKERPFFDPLIVHVSDESMAKEYAGQWPKTCQVLAKAFWPGALTVVTKKNDKVPDIITAGLDSVGLRCPSHPIAQEVIKELGSPVAAPSANKFKRTSPTKREHVLNEFGDEVMVLEGGDSEIGIESTVAGVFEDRVEIYRPGMITSEMIQKAFEEEGMNISVEVKQSPVAPGQLKHHYMPKIPVILSWDDAKVDFSQINSKCANPIEWKLDDPVQSARELYGFFRDAETKNHDCIVIKLDTQFQSQSVWAGVLNRLDKAKTIEAK